MSSLVGGFPIGELMVYGAGVAFLFAVFWVFKLKKERARASVMIPAFLAMSLLMIGFGQGWPSPGLIGLGILLFVLLAVDMAMRSVEHSRRNQESASKKEDQA